MKLRFTERADEDYANLPVLIRKAFEKQLRFLPSPGTDWPNRPGPNPISKLRKAPH